MTTLGAYWGTVELAAVAMLAALSWLAAVPVFVVLAVLIVAAFVWARKHGRPAAPGGDGRERS